MKQRKGTKVYDGEEKFFDRYTMIFPGFEMALGLSGNPNSPQGFFSMGSIQRGKKSWEEDKVGRSAEGSSRSRITKARRE